MDLLPIILAQPPVFLPGSVTLENTVFMFVILGFAITIHRLIDMPVICILAGMICCTIALLETNVYFFPFTNLLVILMGVYLSADTVVLHRHG